MHESAQRRFELITVVQSLGIILVVLGHSYPIGVPQPSLYAWLYKIIYSFHMPLFFFVSGYLFNYSGGYKDNLIRLLQKKGVRLLIPYVAISSLAFFPKVLLAQYSLRKTELTLSSFLVNIFYPLDNVLGHFWFLPTLFMLFLVVHFIIKVYKSEANWLLLGTIIVIGVYALNYYIGIRIKLFNLSGVIRNLPFFWIGIVIASYPEFLTRLLVKKNCLSITLGILLLLNNSVMQFPLKDVLTSLVGITMIFAIGNLYLKYNMKAFCYIDGLSYQIFLLSWPIQAIINILAYKVLGLGWYPTFFSMFIFGLIGPAVLIKIFAQYRLPGKVILGL